MIEAAKLGETLVRAKLITEAQLRQAIAAQETTGDDLRDVLPRLGLIGESALAAHIAREQLMHFVDPDTSEVDEDLMARIPRALIERHQIVPLRGEHGVLLALSDPDDFQAIDEVQFVTNSPVESALAPKTAIRRVIERFYERQAGAAPRGRRGSSDERPRAGAARSPAPTDAVRRVLALPGETLLRAVVLALIEKEELDAGRILDCAERAEAAAGRGGTAFRSAARPGGEK